MPAYTRLNGVSTVDQNGLIEQLKENLMEYFNYGLLEAGGYTDVGIASQYDTEDNTLELKHVNHQADGKIWQANHSDWVWESNLESERQPVQVSGVYVNGVFRSASSTDQYKHYINYPKGIVVFDQPLPASSVVQAEYSYRWVSFYDQSERWFRDVIFDSLRYEIGSDTPSGVIGLLNQNSIQLPAVVVESVASRTMIPKQLGDLSQWVYQDFIIHILSETVEDRDFLVDIFMLQKDVTFYLFNTNARLAAKALALDLKGRKNLTGLMYPALVQNPPVGFRWNKCKFTKIVGQETTSKLPLFRATLRLTLEVDFKSLS